MGISYKFIIFLFLISENVFSQSLLMEPAVLWGIISPKQGDTLFVGNSIEIRWILQSQNSINIRYSSDNGTTWIEIDSYVSHMQQPYNWRIPNILSNNCILRIENSKDRDEFYQVDNLVIVYRPFLEINQLSGNKFYYGDSLEISWYTFDVDSIKIQFSSDNGETWETIVESYPAEVKKFIWMLPIISSEACRFRISSLLDTSLVSISRNTFSILLHSILFEYPGTFYRNEMFREGDIVDISWSTDFKGSLKLEFSSDNKQTFSFVDSINANVADSYAWKVPDVNSEFCYLRLTYYETSLMMSLSEKFKVINGIRIRDLIESAAPGDTIFLNEGTQYECLEIIKPITLIGKGSQLTKLISISLNSPLVIKSDNVTIKEIFISPKIKTSSIPYCEDNPAPTDGLRIENSANIILENVEVRGGTDNSTFPVSGGTALIINNSHNIELINSKIFGGDCSDRTDYQCGRNGGDALNINNSQNIIINNSKIEGGRGRGTNPHSWSIGPGGFGGDALSSTTSDLIIINSILKGGEGGGSRGNYDILSRTSGGDGSFFNDSQS